MNIYTGWLLSGISYLGPYPDIDRLTDLGFYKKKTLGDIPIRVDIEDSRYLNYKQQYTDFLQDMEVVDRESFYSKVNELLDGSEQDEFLGHFYGISRILTEYIKDSSKELVVNGHHYSRKVVNVLNDFEKIWPSMGSFAYDLCNLVLLLRLGVSKTYMNEEEARVYMSKIIHRMKASYKSIKNFARDAVICRRIHLSYLEAIDSSRSLPFDEKTLVIAYYGLFSYLQLDINRD